LSCSRASFTTKGKAQDLEGMRQPFGTLGFDGQKLGKAFGKGAFWAVRVIAKETADLEDKLHGLVADRKIARCPLVATMDASRKVVTSWTLSLYAGCVRDNDE
jgi:hypothetical protein